VSIRLAVALLLSILLPFGAPLAAQDEPAAEPAAQEAPPPVPPGLISARATMRTFLEAFASSGQSLEKAARCLDLSGIRDDVRTYKGKELAWQLKQVIDRTQLIVFEDIPADPRGEPYVLPVQGFGEIVIGPGENGAWRFTAETVAAVPELYEATRDIELVAGVTQSAEVTPAMWLRAQMPESLQARSFLLENWQWLGMLVLLVLGMLLDRLITGIVRAAVEGYLERRVENVGKGELSRALRPLGVLVAALVWWPGIFWLGLPTRFLEVAVVAIKFATATAFVWLAYRVVDVVTAVLDLRARRSEGKFDDLLVPLVGTASKVVVVAFGLLFIADTLDLPIASVVAGLGIGGLAVALAAQDAVKNFFGSLMVIIDRPFSVGDAVKIGDVEGSVAELGFRSTRIRTFYNSLVTIPNGNLISATVDNLGARQIRRWRTMLSLTYDTPPEKIETFCEGVRQLILDHPLTVKDSFHVWMNEFSSSSLDVLLQTFFDTTDYAEEMRGRHQLALAILRLADELGVEFAFPTQTVHMAQPT